MNFSIEVFHPEVPQKDTTIQHKKRPNKLPKALPSPTGFNYRRGLMIKMHFRNVPLHMCRRSQVLFVGLPLGISLSSSIGTRKGGHTFWSNLLLKKVKGHIDLSILLHTPFPKKKKNKKNKQTTKVQAETKVLDNNTSMSIFPGAQILSSSLEFRTYKKSTLIFTPTLRKAQSVVFIASKATNTNLHTLMYLVPRGIFLSLW